LLSVYNTVHSPRFVGHKKAQAAATQKLQAAEAEKEAEPLSLEERLSKENLEAEVELAASLDKKFRDGGGQQINSMRCDVINRSRFPWLPERTFELNYRYM
jgi:hypothetical protein